MHVLIESIHFVTLSRLCPSEKEREEEREAQRAPSEFSVYSIQNYEYCLFLYKNEEVLRQESKGNAGQFVSIRLKIPYNCFTNRVYIAFSIPSAATFGFAALLALTYLSDWRLLTNYIPLYNTKYPKQPTK